MSLPFEYSRARLAHKLLVSWLLRDDLTKTNLTITKSRQEPRYGGAFWTKMQSNRDLHSIGSYPCSIGSYLSSIRSYFHSTGSYLSSIQSYLNYFVASYMTLVYSSVVFHIYPYLRGNSIPSDRNYRSAVVTIWSAVKRGRLNLDLVLVWRHTTYDYMTYNWKSSRTWSHADGVDSVYISRHILSWIKEIRIQETFKETFSKEQQMYWELF